MRSLAGPGATIVGGTVFVVLLVLLLARSTWLLGVDAAVIEAANAFVSERDRLISTLQVITNLGGTEASWLLLPIAIVWLLIRRLPRLALYIAVTGLGAIVLTTGVKALVDRARPTVDAVLLTTPDASFPSGHALGSVVAYGVLLLVFLPAVPPRWRRVVEVGVLVLVVLIGASRVALGVHFPSDVVGGWALGAVWLAVTATAFRRWSPDGRADRPVLEVGLHPGPHAQLTPAPERDGLLPDHGRTVARILVGFVALWGVLLGLGLLITGALRAPVEAFDGWVVDGFVAIRNDELTAIAEVVGRLGSTLGVVLALLVAVALALALTRRRTPALFLVLAVVGETALFLLVADIVGRERPPVEHLTETLPPTSSFPSGHVAAAAAVYGSIALLVRAWLGRRAGRAALSAAALIVVAVALSRMYRGMHHLTDVLASAAYTSAWLAVLWASLRPDRGAPRATTSPTPPAATLDGSPSEEPGTRRG
ncbi:MAG: phosphatase PAP2 family protein [Nitriliruptoraceae bacterium]